MPGGALSAEKSAEPSHESDEDSWVRLRICGRKAQSEPGRRLTEAQGIISGKTAERNRAVGPGLGDLPTASPVKNNDISS